MNIKKTAVLYSSFMVLAALLTSGCAASIAVAETAPATTAAQPGTTSANTTANSVEPVMTTAATQSTTVEAGYTPVAPWDNLPEAVLADFTPAQLWADYKADPEAADVKYYGKVFLFKNVVIEDMAMLYKGYASPADAWVQNNGAYFRTENKSRIFNLKVGYVVDIEGMVTGPLQNFVMVDYCKYTIVDTTNGVTRPDWITVFA